MNRILNVTDNEGNKVSLEVIDIISDEEFGKEFIIYKKDGVVVGSLLVENEEDYTIENITDENELLYITNVINNLEI